MSVLKSGVLDQKDVSGTIHRIILQAAIYATSTVCSEMDEIPKDVLVMHIRPMHKKGLILDEELEPLADEIDVIYDMDICPSLYLPSMDEYLSEVRITNIINDARRSKKTTKEVADAIKAEALRSSSVSSRGARAEIIDPLESNLMDTAPVMVVPTGLSCIDSPLNGGLPKGEMGIVCAITGVGKTSLGINFCWNAAKLGYDAMFFTLELTGKQISDRLYSLISGIPYRDILHGIDGDMEEVRRRVDEHITQESPETRRRFSIADFSSEQCSSSSIRQKINETIARKGKAPDMIVVDWLDAMAPEVKHPKAGGKIVKELRHQLLGYCEDLQYIAKEFGMAVWTMTQSNGSAEGKRSVRMSNASEGFSKSFRTAVFLGIGATQEDASENRVTVTGAKNRFGPKFVTQMEARMDIQRFMDLDVDEESVSGFLSINR